MMTVKRYVVIESDVSPTSYGDTLETLFRNKHHVAGTVECAGERVFLEGLYEIKDIKEADGQRRYILEQVPI